MRTGSIFNTQTLFADPRRRGLYISTTPLEEKLLRQEANNGNALDLNAAVSSAFATTTVSSATSCWVTLARPLYAI
jgi:hypothetical protein